MGKIMYNIKIISQEKHGLEYGNTAVMIEDKFYPGYLYPGQEIVGIVSKVIDGNTFELCVDAFIPILDK